MVSKKAPEQTDVQEELSFEQILSRLKQLVDELEKGDTPLEQSLAIFEEGVRLSELGTRRLDEAEHRIEVLLNTKDGVQTQPLNKEPDSQ